MPAPTPKQRESAKEYRRTHPKQDSVAAFRARVLAAEAKRRKNAGMPPK